jgi:8-oxo-dGTP pyrophosphatase MutT (NUDIX family)
MAARTPTHAGGVVYRIVAGHPRFLLVTARRSPHAWVYPKGHIEDGETPEDTATREVEEESGVDATVVERIGDVRIHLRGEDQTIRYFLMQAIRSGSPREGRRRVWLPASDALQYLSFPETRTTLRKARKMLRGNGAV